MKKSGEENISMLLEHAARQAGRSGKPVYSRFFPASDMSQAVHFARMYDTEVSFDGGRPDAERVQACFHFPGDEPAFSGEWMHILWNTRFAHVEHRDLLGSLMGLYGDRSWFGDLIVLEEEAYLRTTPDMARRLQSEWTQAGHSTIRVEPCSFPQSLEKPQGREMRITVASPRLDAVLSDGMRLSRSKGADLVRAGAVAVNHHEETRPDYMLRPDDLLSVRGHGRIRVVRIEENNRRGRVPVVLEVFLSK